MKYEKFLIRNIRLVFLWQFLVSKTKIIFDYDRKLYRIRCFREINIQIYESQKLIYCNVRIYPVYVGLFLKI